MSYRSVWKGFLQLAQIACPVKIYAAAVRADEQSFTAFNPKTGNKLNFARVDAGTGEFVEFKDVGKGVEIASGVYAQVTKDELADAAPRSIHTIEIQELVPRTGINWLFPDAVYYLGPDGIAAGEAFGLLRDAIKASRLVALGQLSLGMREHLVMMEPGKKVLKLSTLRYAEEVRAEDACFPELLNVPYPEELSAPVQKILAARSVDRFDAGHFTDRYGAALAKLVREKIAGTMVKRVAPPPPRLIDLRKAVKRSAGADRRLDGPRGKKKNRAA